MFIHLDAVGGVAGDMFIAAVGDTFPSLRDGVLGSIRHAGVPADVQCRFEPCRDHALTGTRFVVDVPTRAGAHDHRHFADIRQHLLASTLSPEVKHHAVAIFTILASAEARIHGHAVDDVSFHELGEWDSIADIVGAAYLITAVEAEGWTIGTLPLGSGFVQTAHGRLPVPVPATALILEGYEFADDGLAGERISPTGAAIVRHLACRQTRDTRGGRLVGTGYGFGARHFPGISNVLRVLAFETASRASGDDEGRVAVLAFEVDDQTPEDLAIALDRLRAHPAVLDVLHMPAFGKKGRIAAHVQVLADPGELQAVMDCCFVETTTLGIRHQIVDRRALPRHFRTVQVGGHPVRVKIAQRPEAPSAKAESDDTRHLAGHDSRAQLRRAAEAAGLDREA
jgi:uncharacterized protein (TIGR00299 family) protein